MATTIALSEYNIRVIARCQCCLCRTKGNKIHANLAHCTKNASFPTNLTVYIRQILHRLIIIALPYMGYGGGLCEIIHRILKKEFTGKNLLTV